MQAHPESSRVYTKQCLLLPFASRVMRCEWSECRPGARISCGCLHSPPSLTCKEKHKKLTLGWLNKQRGGNARCGLSAAEGLHKHHKPCRKHTHTHTPRLSSSSPRTPGERKESASCRKWTGSIFCQFFFPFFVSFLALAAPCLPPAANSFSGLLPPCFLSLFPPHLLPHLAMLKPAHSLSQT